MATITRYDTYLQKQNNGTGIDWDTDTVKVALATAAYTPSASTNEFFSDVTNEVTGSGYTAGGTTLTGVTVTQAGGVTTVDAADTVFTDTAGAPTTCRYAIIYKSTGTPATSPLYGYIDFTSDKGFDGNDLTLQWNASGIFTVA